MEIWLYAFIGGFIGSYFMDVTENKISKYGVSSGVNAAYIGRWFMSLIKGKFIHNDISKTPSIQNEIRIGILFHFIIGGGAVALLYPVFFYFLASTISTNHLIMASLFGLLTSAFPWLILMPSLGWGFFGSSTPFPSRPILSPILSHLPYGFGIGLTITILSTVTNKLI